MKNKPLVLCILDGVGISKEKKHNAVVMAKMPFYNKLFEKYPTTKLGAYGATVGLPPHTMGNSEIGHITIGAGRVVNQFLRRFQIDQESGKLAKNPGLLKFILDVKKSGGVVHLLGMMSDGLVHSDIKQTIVVAKIILKSGLDIRWHFISDGRDVSPKSVKIYAKQLYDVFATDIKNGKIKFATLSGRYYAMDRNNNWNRTLSVFDAVALGKSKFHAKNLNDAIKSAYARGESDEFIKPIVIGEICPMTAADGLLFTNHRADRARQILKAIALPKILEIKRPMGWTPPHILAFSQYGEGLDKFCPALLFDIPIKNTFGDIIAKAGLSQLRIAETEKYNHVTYFFDAERTINFPKEEKILIPSPNVATFDLKPEMSAIKITNALIKKLKCFDVIILNYANGDMLGHTGIEKAAMRAMEILDVQMAKFVPKVLELGGVVLITADHGNAEKMRGKDGKTPWTAHTTNPVPFIIVSNNKLKIHTHKDAGLADIAPTMLKILGIKQPADMTGKSLI